VLVKLHNGSRVHCGKTTRCGASRKREKVHPPVKTTLHAWVEMNSRFSLRTFTMRATHTRGHANSEGVSRYSAVDRGTGGIRLRERGHCVEYQPTRQRCRPAARCRPGYVPGKTLGKARCEVFDTAMHATAVTRLKLETELRKAIEHGELRVHYQPIVRLSDTKIVGFESTGAVGATACWFGLPGRVYCRGGRKRSHPSHESLAAARGMSTRCGHGRRNFPPIHR